MQLRAANEESLRLQDLPNQQPKGTIMKCASIVKAAAAVAVAVGLAACTDIKPLQAEVADLKAQLAKVQGDASAAKSSADQANSAAQSSAGSLPRNKYTQRQF